VKRTNIMHILIGLIILSIGLIFIIKTEWFMSNVGRIGWFEEHLATSGGSRMGYKLLGMLVVFIGILFITDMIGGMLRFVLSPLLSFY